MIQTELLKYIKYTEHTDRPLYIPRKYTSHDGTCTAETHYVMLDLHRGDARRASLQVDVLINCILNRISQICKSYIYETP